MNYQEIKHFSRKLRKNQTYHEKMLWERLRDRQLEGFKFLRQHPILYDRHGNDLNFFIPDFFCSTARLAIELDGSSHNGKQDYDQWRSEILSKMHITVLRFKNEELYDIANVISKIKENLMLRK